MFCRLQAAIENSPGVYETVSSIRKADAKHGASGSHSALRASCFDLVLARTPSSRGPRASPATPLTLAVTGVWHSPRKAACPQS